MPLIAGILGELVDLRAQVVELLVTSALRTGCSTVGEYRSWRR